MTAERRSRTGTVDKAPLKEPRTDGKTREMERAPGAVGAPADRCFFPRKRRRTASRTGTERSAGDAQQSNPRKAVPRMCGETADPRETYPSTPPNPSFMGAAKASLTKEGIQSHVPRAFEIYTPLRTFRQFSLTLLLSDATPWPSAHPSSDHPATPPPAATRLRWCLPRLANQGARGKASLPVNQ